MADCRLDLFAVIFKEGHRPRVHATNPVVNMRCGFTESEPRHLFGQRGRMGCQALLLFLGRELTRFNQRQCLHQRFCSDAAHHIKQFAACHFRVNGHRFHHQNVAGIEPFIELHNGHASLLITVENGPLNRRRAAVLGKQ